MERSNQGAQLTLLHILEFVDEEDQCRTLVKGGGAGGTKELAEIVVENPAVGEAALTLEFYPDLETLIRDSHGASESGQGLQCPLRGSASRREAVHSDQGRTQRSRE